MRIILSILFLSVCYPQECGTEDMNEEENERYERILDDLSQNSYLNRSNSINIEMIPITFYLIQNGNGYAPKDIGDVEQLIMDVNEEFGDLGIRFYEHSVNYIDDSTYYNIDRNQSEQSKLMQDFNTEGSLNVYLVKSICDCDTDEWWGGFASYTGNYVFITYSSMYPPNNIFIHEVGHHMYLRHTHQGSEDEDEDHIIDGDYAEYVDGTECDIRGDKLCDTPADPKLSKPGININSNCDYYGDYIDGHGDTYLPDTENYMSYTRNSCREHFSEHQKEVILYRYYYYRKGNYIDCNGELSGTLYPDCTGVCGGDQIIDECGICEGDGSTCSSCNTGHILLFGTCYPIAGTDSLVLRNMGVSGDIPSEIDNLENLTTLNLSYNQLITLPESIGNLINLETLDLSSNELTSLPESIGNLNSLETLDLSSTQLTTLPQSICDIYSNLQNLNFSNNQICPPYPECISNDDLQYQSQSNCQSMGCADNASCNVDMTALYPYLNDNCFYADEYYTCNGNCIDDIDENEICDEIGNVHLEIQDVNIDSSTIDILVVSDQTIGAVQFKIIGVAQQDSTDYIINEHDLQWFFTGHSTFSDSLIFTHKYNKYLGGKICFDEGADDPPPINMDSSWVGIIPYITDYNNFETWENGDLNKDGVINISDMAKLRSCFFLNEPCSQYDNADINGNSVYDIYDFLILNYWIQYHMEDRSILSVNIDGNPMHTTVGSCFCDEDTDEDGICDDMEFIGCQEETACNYDVSATDLGDCIHTDGVCDTCVDGEIVDNDADDDTVCDDMEIIGCQDDSACNYNANATELGDCIYTDVICDTCVEGVKVDNDADDDTVCDDIDNCPETVEETVDENGCSQGQLSISISLIPEDFNLHSIYPNPFNPVTNIIYGLPEHVNVQIIVYDLSGKQVETLINDFQTPGYHSVNWNASSYPSGVYLIRMDSGDFTQTQKVVLVK